MLHSMFIVVAFSDFLRRTVQNFMRPDGNKWESRSLESTLFLYTFSVLLFVTTDDEYSHQLKKNDALRASPRKNSQFPTLPFPPNSGGTTVPQKLTRATYKSCTIFSRVVVQARDFSALQQKSTDLMALGVIS